jgi:hypothetical protein
MKKINESLNRFIELVSEALMNDVYTEESASIYFKIFVAIIYSILFIVSIGGNILVIIIVNSKKIQTVTNFFIISLAISDIIFIILCIPPTYITYIYEQWIFGKVLYSSEFLN